MNRFFASRRWTERPKNFLHCFGNWMKGLKSGYPGVMTRFCYRPRWRTRTNHEQLDWAILLQKTNPIFLQRIPTIIKTNPLQSSRWKRQTSIFLPAEGYKPAKWFGRCMEMFYPQTTPTIQTSMLSLLFLLSLVILLFLVLIVGAAPVAHVAMCCSYVAVVGSSRWRQSQNLQKPNSYPKHALNIL